MFSENNTTFNAYEQNSVVIKGFFRKPIILLLVILQAAFGFCYSVSFVLNHFIMATFAFRPSFFIDLLTIALYFPMAVGYILVYSKSRDKNSSNLASGFKVLHLTSVIKLILSLTNVAVIFFKYNELESMIEEYISGSFIGDIFAFIFSLLLFIILAIIVMVFIVVILFYLTQIKFFASIKKSLQTISLSYKGAILFAVFNLILAVFMVIGASNGFIDQFTGGSNFSLRATMPNVTMLLACILFITNTCMALGYRKHIRKAMYGYDITDAEQPLNVSETPDATIPAFNQAPVEKYKTYTEVAKNVSEVCPYCKEKTNPDTVFCNSCGRKIK